MDRSMEAIFAAIEKQLVNKFESKIKSKMDKKFYQSIFLGIVLGEDLFPMTEEDFQTIKNIDNNKFANYCHKIIDCVSLCDKEIDFLHQIVNLETTDHYVEKCMSIYRQIEGLNQCQLGDIMFKCLDLSMRVELY